MKDTDKKRIGKRIGQDNLLINMKKSFENINNKGTINITIKRNITDKIDKKNPKSIRKKRNELLKNLENEVLYNDSLLLRFKTNKDDQNSTIIKNENIKNYINSFLNLSSLFFFKDQKNNINKRIKKPTEKNPESKRSNKRRMRVKLINDKKNILKTKKLEKKNLKEKLIKLSKNLK